MQIPLTAIEERVVALVNMNGAITGIPNVESVGIPYLNENTINLEAVGAIPDNTNNNLSDDFIMLCDEEYSFDTPVNTATTKALLTTPTSKNCAITQNQPRTNSNKKRNTKTLLQQQVDGQQVYQANVTKVLNKIYENGKENNKIYKNILRLKEKKYKLLKEKIENEKKATDQKYKLKYEMLLLKQRKVELKEKIFNIE